MAIDGLAKRVKHLELIGKIGLEIASVLDLDKLLPAATVLTTKTLGYENCAILLAEGDRLIVKAAYRYPKGLKRRRIPIRGGIVGACAQSGKIVNVGDVSKDPRYIPSGLKGIRSEIAIPIVFGDTLLGVLTIESARKDAFREEDELALGILCSQLGVAIRNSKLTQAKNRELQLLHRVGLQIVSNIDLDRLLATIVTLIGDNLGYKSCAVFLPEGDKLILRAQTHFTKKVLGLEVPFGKGIVGRCAKTMKPVKVADVSRCSFYIPSGLRGVKSALALPIPYNASLVGVLAAESSRLDAYGEEDVRLLTILTSQIGVALKNAEMHAEIKRLAVRDSLTKLYNHRYFTMRLEQETARARRYGRPLSLVLIDLDDFKSINDTFGHLAGDDVLVSVAQVILSSIRTSDSSSIMKEVEVDVPVRYGGEELMIIMPETPLEGAVVAANRLCKLIREEIRRRLPLRKGRKKLVVTGSFGVASLKGKETSMELVKRVDHAMYKAKRSGKDRVCWGE